MIYYHADIMIIYDNLSSLLMSFLLLLHLSAIAITVIVSHET